MSMIPDEIVEQVRDSADLVGMIGDLRGRVAGFGGRLPRLGEPKYLNSPKNAIHKGKQLYNRHQAKGAIRNAGQATRTAPAKAPAPFPTCPAPSREIDLRGLTGDELEMATVVGLDAAWLADRRYLRIIHGMGTGILRDRATRVLLHGKRIAGFDFAPRNQGGMGVTVAEFKS